jgi:SSS family solute:Na+ symporter
MELWMRIFAAENEKKAIKSYIWSAILVVPFYLFPLFLGLLAIKTMPNINNPDSIFVRSMFKYLPHGILGLGMASLFAVVISTANTMIVVLGATLYRDVLGRPVSGGIRELRYSRLITLLIGIIGVAFSMTIPNIVQLVLNAFFIIAILFPSLLCVAIWKRATSLGATLSIILGGLTTIILIPKMPTQAFLPGLAVSIIALIIGSLLTKRQELAEVFREQ